MERHGHIRALEKSLIHICSIVSDSFVTPWTVVHQVPMSMEFSRQEYRRWLPLLSPVDLPNPGIEPASLVSLASASLAGGFFTTNATLDAH